MSSDGEVEIIVKSIICLAWMEKSFSGTAKLYTGGMGITILIKG